MHRMPTVHGGVVMHALPSAVAEAVVTALVCGVSLE